MPRKVYDAEYQLELPRSCGHAHATEPSALHPETGWSPRSTNALQVQEQSKRFGPLQPPSKVVLATDVVYGAIPYTGIIRLWPHDTSTHIPFVCLYIGSCPFQAQIHATKSGVGIEHFGPTHLKRMVIAMPPAREQENIIAHVESSTAGFSLLVERAQREIAFHRELRIRLIADAVTGQLDVRAAAAALPDEPVEDVPLDEADEPGDEDLDAQALADDEAK